MSSIQQPTVTVILPTHNRRSFLPTAIRSICDQTFRDWILHVVNDGGEDVSDIVASFGDSRIVYHDCPHRGKAAALNYGLKLVQSKYVAYMDDDDIVYPDHLAELVALAESRQAEFVYSDTWLIVVDASGKEVRRQIENDEDVSFETIRFFNRINHKQILHTKRLADETGCYDERLRILIDYDYIRRLAQHSPPVHLRKTTGEHLLRHASDLANDFSSITGLWVSEPEACGASVLAIFGKDPVAMADFYREASRNRRRVRQLESKLAVERERRAAASERAKAASLRAKKAATRLRIVERSISYKTGKIFTAPFRFLFEMLASFVRRQPRSLE